MMESEASVLGGFFGGRKSAASISAAARRHTSATNRVQAAQTKVGELQLQRQDLETELMTEVGELTADWQAKAASVEPVAIELKRTQIRVTDLRLVWVPVAG